MGDKQLEATESYQHFDWSPFVAKQEKGVKGYICTPAYCENWWKLYTVDKKPYRSLRHVKLTSEAKANLYRSSYRKTKTNGVSVSAGATLTLQSPQDMTVRGSAYSGGNLVLKVNPKTGVINCDIGQIESLQDIYLYGHRYVNKRSTLSVLKNTSSYILEKPHVDWSNISFHTFGSLTYHLYTDTPALLQAGGNIYFHLPEVENLGSTIAASGSIYHQEKLVASPTQSFNGAFKNESLSQIYKAHCNLCEQNKELIATYGSDSSLSYTSKRAIENCSFQTHTGYLPSAPAYVLAGQTLSLKNSHVVTTGVANAKHVLIDGHSVYAANISPLALKSLVLLGAHDRRIKDHLILDMTDFAFHEFGSRPGFIHTTEDGRTVSKFALPSNLKLKRENILFLTENDAKFPYVEHLLLDAMEPLFYGQSIVFMNDSFSRAGAALQFSIDLSAMQSVFQRMLTAYLHTQNVQGNSGLQALQDCFDAAGQIRHNHNSGLISTQQLTQYNDLYIVFQVMEQLKKILLKPVLIASAQHINRNTQPGDISGDRVDAKTLGDQTYIGQTVSGVNGINVVAQNLNRETRKRRDTFNQRSTVTSVESLEPQQVFYSEQGAISTFGRTSNTEMSTATVARGDVTRGSDNAIVLGSHVLQTRAYDGDNGQTTHTFAPNQTVSGGTASFASSSVKLVGSAVQATDIVFEGGQSEVTAAQAMNTRRESKTSGGGLFRAKKRHTEYRETPVIQPSFLKAKNIVQFKGRTAELVGAQVSATTLVNKTTLGLVTAPATGMMIHRAESSSRGLFSGTRVKQNIGQEVMVATTLDVDKIVTLGAKLKLISTALPEGMIVDDVYETAKRELTSWNIVESKTTGIPAPVLQLAAIALAIYSGGAAAQSLYGALSGAAGTSAYTGAIATLKLVGTQLGTTLLANGGDMETALKSTFSQQGFLSMTTQVVSAGVLDKLGVVAPKPGAPLPQLVDYGARRATVNAGINVAFGRENVDDAFKNAGVNFVADVIGQVGANKIGTLYNNGEGSIDFTTHKLAHAGLGAGLGALKGDVAAGALGGFVSEMVADLIADDIDVIHERMIENADVDDIEIGSPAFDYLVYQDIQSTMNWGKIASVVTAALIKRDVNIALDTATNALENNFKKQIVKALLKYFTKDGAKETVKQGTKQTAKRLEKQALKEKAKEGFSHDTKRLVGKTDDFKTELLERAGKTKDQTTLRGAQRELKGEQLEVAAERSRTYNHIQKVRQAQKGLSDHIEAINNRLGFPKLPEIERQALQQELSEASKLLDYSKQFVPRK